MQTFKTTIVDIVKQYKLQKGISNFIVLGLSQCIVSFLGIINSGILAKSIGSYGYGQLAFGWAIINYLSIFIDAGLEIFGAKAIARKNNIYRVFLSILLIRLVLLLISVCLFFVVIVFFQSHTFNKTLILFQGLLLITPTFSVKYLFQGLQKMGYLGFSQVLEKGLFFILISLFIYSGKDILKVPVFQSLTILISYAFLYFIVFYRLNIKNNKITGQNENRLQIIKMYFPIWLSIFITQIYNNFDIIVLGMHFNPDILGYYQASLQVVTFFIIFASILSQVLLPMYVNASLKSKETVIQMVRLSHKFIFILFLPLLILFFLFSDHIITIIFSNAYAASIFPLRILLFSVFIMMMNIPFSISLIVFDKQKHYLMSVLSGAVTNVLLNLIFIPFFGIIAAPIIRIISETAVILSLYYFYRKNIQNYFDKT